MNKVAFATLIGYVTYILSGTRTLCLTEIDEISQIVERGIDKPELPSKVSCQEIDELLQLMAGKEKKIDAIRVYRQLTGAFLKDAKDAIERYW